MINFQKAGKTLRKASPVLAILTLLGVAFIVVSPHAHANDTSNYNWVRPDNWLSQNIASPTGGAGQGHITVDIEFNNGTGYNPCHNVSDTYEAACSNAGGFYKVQRYTPGSSDFPYGIFIDNSNNGVNHFWARRVKTVYLEVYPYSIAVAPPLDGYRLDPGACNCIAHGGFQIIVNDWKGGYSASIGKVHATSLAESDVGRLNGFIKRSGANVHAGDVNIDWFGQDANHTRSSTGYPVYSFTSWPTNADGYYTSGPVLKGNFHIYVTDKGPNQAGPVRRVECVGVPIRSTTDRADLELTATHFGLDAPGRQCYDR